RRRVAASRPRPLPADGPNQVWAYAFVFDACANGQQLKCLVVTDEWTHEALAIDVQGSIRSRRVIEVLAKLVSEHGAPRYLRSDNVLTLESSRKYGCKHPQTRNAPDRVSHLRACTQSRGLPRLQDLLI